MCQLQRLRGDKELGEQGSWSWGLKWALGKTSILSYAQVFIQASLWHGASKSAPAALQRLCWKLLKLAAQHHVEWCCFVSNSSLNVPLIHDVPGGWVSDFLLSFCQIYFMWNALRQKWKTALSDNLLCDLSSFQCLKGKISMKAPYLR